MVCATVGIVVVSGEDKDTHTTINATVPSLSLTLHAECQNLGVGVGGGKRKIGLRLHIPQYFTQLRKEQARTTS